MVVRGATEPAVLRVALRPAEGATQEPVRPVTAAVIVAAGKGSRLRTPDGPPKPLAPLVGVPLIRRVMASAAKAGIRRFVVVIGHRAQDLRGALPGLVPPGCGLDLVDNPRFEEPNGVSLLAGVATIEEPFVLLMSDHVFSPDRLALALARFGRTGRSLLVVEDRARFRGDLEDATRVLVRGDTIVAIGKTLGEYTAIDTGMFVLRPKDVTWAAGSAGRSPTISRLMGILADGGRLDALAVDVGFWQDVDTPQDVLLAQRCLYASLVKPTDGVLASRINRRISLALSTRIWRLGATPNGVTSFTLLLGLSAGAAFAQGGGVAWGLAGATLFQLQSIVDGVDGELARLLHRESRFGFWYDLAVDNVTHMAVFAGVALGQLADGAPGPWAALGALAVAGVAASFAVMAPLLAHPPGERGDTGRDARLQGLVDGLSRRDFTYLLFPLALLGWLGGFLWAAAIGTWAYAAAVLVLRLRFRGRARRVVIPAAGETPRGGHGGNGRS